MAHYLITGGCGFIGSHLCHRLIARGDRVSVIDNLSVGKREAIPPTAKLYVEDVIDYEAIAPLFKDVDAVFHLAAIPSVELTQESWLRLHRINLDGTLNVFKACMAHGNVPVIYASSCAVYGKVETTPLCEETMVAPISAYACDKYSAELNARFLAHDFHLPSIGLRFFNVYGPGQNPNSPYSGVITKFIEAALHHQPMTIFGDGQQTRDFVFVEDIVDGLIHALNKYSLDAPVYNLCTGHAITITKLASLISRACGVEEQTQHLEPRAFDVLYSCGSPILAELNGFRVHTSIADGILKTVAYFKEGRG